MKINGIEFFVEDLGNPKGEVIVFLNGVMASTSSWKELSKWFIENDYRVILHDFKGQLKSDKPKGPYYFKDHARETVEILKVLGVSKAHFIGTSYGGEVALNIGFRHPEVVQSLSIINSVSEIDALLETHINHWIQLCKQKDGYQFFWGMAPSIYGPKFLEEHKDFLEERAKATAHIDPSYFEGQITLYETFKNDVTMTSYLHKIKAPTLIIGTELDILKPMKFSKIMANQIEQSELVEIKNTGHVTIFEAPEELSTLLIGFVNKHQKKR